MKVNRKELLGEMKKITKTVGSANNAQPIVKGVLVEYGQNLLKLSATNLVTSIICKLTCETDMTTNEAFIVDAKLLHSIISKLTNEEVKFTFDKTENTLRIVSGRSKFNIKSMGVKDDFPVFEIVLQEKKSINISAEILRDVVNKTVRFTADDETKPTLQGVNLIFSKGNITGVSLDGFRLAHYSADIECEYEKNIIVDANALTNISNSIDGESIIFSYSEESKLLEFVLGETSIYSSQIEGKFFDYKAILKPEDAKTTIVLEKAGLKSSVERASIMAVSGNTMNPIVFSIKDKELIINSNSDVGKVEEKIEIKEEEGEAIDYKIAFNSRYILDGINSIDSESIEFRLNGGLNPAYLIDKDNGYIYLALPIRLKD